MNNTTKWRVDLLKRMIVAGIACIAVVAEAVHGDVVVENAKFRLVLGADAIAQSLDFGNEFGM